MTSHVDEGTNSDIQGGILNVAVGGIVGCVKENGSNS